MGGRYGQIAFTPAVAEVQSQHGSRSFYSRRQSRLEASADPDVLGDDERAFLAERDSFYIASVGQSGWPYVQYRGGPVGFLHVLDEHTIAWADFRGNFQYITVGNLFDESRVALIIMDYPHRQRLKVFGHARVVERRQDPDLVGKLVDPGYDAEVEAAIVLTVAAFDWNCRQHITRRYTADEVERLAAPLRRDLDVCREENRELRTLLYGEP
jgi:predicted pyridoxine 5'-phosphate oxidase superfamily flavin-nucleotide-binding protein